jgi:diguanylate cyclase (GGDEF)-like protein
VLRAASLAAAIVAGGVAPAVAQPESARFTRLSVEHGLSQSSVLHILQDRKGLIWFGTQEGLNRYDGYRFTVHRAREQDGFLRDHEINALIEDARGGLWVGTSMGLYRHELDTGRFEKCAPPVDGLGIVELIQSGDGRIVFATSDGRLWTLDPADRDRRARALNDGAFAGLTNVTALASGAGSTIWAAAQGRLFKLDLQHQDPRAGARLTTALQDVGTVSVMTVDRHGDVWIGRTDDDLLRYHPADGRVERFPRAPRRTLALLVGKGGELWIGARGGGLTRLDPATGQLTVYRHDPENPASLSSDDVPAIYEDAIGGIWVGSWNGGVNRLDPNAQGFRTFRHRARVADSLPADDVTEMTETSDGSLWLVSRSGIVGAGDPRTGRFRTAAVLSNGGRPTAIAAWEARILVGTSRGLVVLAAPSGREEPLDPAFGAHGLGERPIAAIRGAPGGISGGTSGVAWIASEKALYRVARADAEAGPRVRVRVERFDVPIDGEITTLSIAGDGRLWIGSDRGEVVRAAWSGPDAAVVLQPLDVAAASPRDLLAAHGVVSALHEDRQGRLWIGTRRGLGRVALASGTVSWIGQPEGLPSTDIASIVGDGDGRIWVGHNRGLTRLGDSTSGVMTHFGDHDGAQGNGYAEGAWAAGASGLIYLAGEGITAFDPREVGVSRSTPRIVFTSLEILHRVVAPRWLEPDSPLDRTIDAQSEVTLDPGATVFSVEMAPIHYADPPSNRLRYRLDGFDRGWIETDAHNRVATYTNLAPGSYVLRARAGTKHGLWSEQEAVVTIHLLPPWWRTNMALAGWGALAIAAAVGIRRATRRRARVKLALLEREALRRDSVTDPLTGLHNRRFLISWLEQEMPKLMREYRARGAESGADLLLLLIDVDHFKSINDRLSHGVGDRTLALIAGVLKEHIRGSDLAVRWGGDEFLVVTRSFQRARAADSAERLRAAVEALGTAEAAEGGPAATVSIGFAAYPFLPHAPEALSWEQTLELADHALRLCKRRRRNSYTGLRATNAVTPAVVLEFLARRGGAPLPDVIEILTPPDKSEA